MLVIFMRKGRLKDRDQSAKKLLYSSYTQHNFKEHCQIYKRSGSILSVLIWVQTVCTDHQQETKVAISKESYAMAWSVLVTFELTLSFMNIYAKLHPLRIIIYTQNPK